MIYFCKRIAAFLNFEIRSLIRSKTRANYLARKIADGVCREIYSRMYVCSSYDFRKHHSSVVVAEHTIFDLRMMNRAEPTVAISHRTIDYSYLLNAVVIPVKLECFLFHLTISSGGVVGYPMSPRMPNNTTQHSDPNKVEGTSGLDPNLFGIFDTSERRDCYYFNSYRVPHKLIIDIRWGCCIFTRTLYKYNGGVLAGNPPRQRDMYIPVYQ